MLNKILKKVLILENYDSFTYNLVYLLKTNHNYSLKSFRTDQFYISDLDIYNKFLVSPGPGVPNQFGILNILIKTFLTLKSILGICLGEQTIAENFGALLKKKKNVYHCVYSHINIIDLSEKLFKGFPNKIKVGRYHSWIVSKTKFPKLLKILAISLKGEIMAIRHKYYDIYGLQFHPESILTTYGEKLLDNWLNL